MSSALYLPRNLYTAAQTRALDAIAIETCGTSGIELMERAGRRAFVCMARAWPGAARAGVLCGGGNNGGDGYVVARLALEGGLEVHVGALANPRGLTGDAALAYARFTAAGGRVLADWRGALRGTDVLVDAILGTGADRALRGEWLEAVHLLNVSPAPVVALDVPSGLCADTGSPLGAAVKAELTVGFIGLNRGLFTGLGRNHTGRIEYAHLGLESLGLHGERPFGPFAEVMAGARRARASHFCGVLGRRSRAAHKGRHGHVLVIGGDLGMSGAPLLAASAAARSGAGLVSVATRAAHAPAMAAAWPELMIRGVESPDALAPLIERASVVCIGPGLGTASWGRAMLLAALDSRRPGVFDADALNLIAALEAGSSASGALNSTHVLTPHPAEAGRLLAADAASIEQDRFAAIEALQARWGAIVVLKGAGTLVAGPAKGTAGEDPADRWPAGVTLVADEGNPGMATGGSGDALSGVIGALVAQGLDPASAARAGVCVHAAAGDAAAQSGERGTVAGDLIGALRAEVNRL